MKKLLVLVTSLVALGFAASASDAAVTMNTTIHSEFTFVDPCTNESVFVSGDVHLVISSTVTDNSISSHNHSDFNATGIGLAFRYAVSLHGDRKRPVPRESAKR